MVVVIGGTSVIVVDKSISVVVVIGGTSLIVVDKSISVVVVIGATSFIVVVEATSGVSSFSGVVGGISVVVTVDESLS